jgi:hypothetical protein
MLTLMRIDRLCLAGTARPQAWVLFAFLLLLPGFARAEEPLGSRDEPDALKRHRISGALGLAVVNSFFSELGKQGSKEEFQFRGAYSYRMVTGLELGGDVGYWKGPHSKGFMTTFRVRPYVPLKRDVELAANFAFGVFMRPQSIGTPRGWIGDAWSIGPEVRVWISQGVGVGGSIEASEGCVRGSPSSFGATPRDCFVAVGVALGVVGRL